MKEGWGIKRWMDVLEIRSGRNQKDVENPNGKYPILGSAGKTMGFADEYICEEGTTIVGRKGTIDNPLLIETKFWNVDTAFGLHALDGLDKKFLFYFCRGFDFTKQDKGSGRPSLVKSDLLQIQIPLPPLPEQKRIVAILDKAFTAIAKAKANAEQNLLNAKELFESYLNRFFEEIGDDWEKKEFKEILTILTDYHANGSYKILKKNVTLKDDEDYAWMVRSTDFEQDFQNQFKYIDEHGYNFLNKSKVLGNEIIMSKIGNAGKVYLMPMVEKPTSLAMNLFLIRINENKALPKFVFQYLKSFKGDMQIKSRLNGATTKTITKDNVKSIIIPFPSLKEQQAIVKKLDALSFEAEKLKTIYQQKIEDLEELKKSILQKAFNGELYFNNRLFI